MTATGDDGGEAAPPDHFTLEGDYAAYRPAGVLPLQRCVTRINAAIAYARKQKLPRLLIVTTGLSGFATPGPMDRLWMAECFARSARGRVKVSMVARRELIHPHRIGVREARRRGLDCDIFSVEAEAVAWLRGGRTA